MAELVIDQQQNTQQEMARKRKQALEVQRNRSYLKIDRSTF